MEADKHKLSQVIRNFTSNAIKFTPAGGSIFVNVSVHYDSTLQTCVTEQLSPRATRSNPVLRLEVRDTGCGIAKVTCD